MPAPSATARGTPSGIKVRDGFATKITISGKTTISFWEKSVQPFGMDGGAMIDLTTMHNTKYETFTPRSLIKVTDSAVKALYDPGVLTDIIAILNVEKTITITFPDGSTWCDYGCLREFKPESHEIGKAPEASLVFSFTNADPTTETEEAPVVVSVAGT